MNARLELTREQMRQIGYRVVDLLAEHWSTLSEAPVGAKETPEALMAALREPAPEEGHQFDTVLERLERDVFANVLHVHHPRFFAFVPSPANFVSAMGDALASGFNVFAGTWMGGSAAAALELVVIDWIRNWIGIPETGGGLLVSGGTVANLTGLAVARHALLGDGSQGAVIYVSDQVHSAVDKSLKVLGFAPSQTNRIPAGGDYRMPVEELRRRIAEDRKAGRRPFCVVATAGTTNTGAVDPLEDLAAVCRSEGLWFHVDGAYGAAAAVCPEGRSALRGLEHADSVSLDPHKWLFQTFETGCVLVKDVKLLQAAFSLHPEYLADVHRHEEEVHFTDRGIQLTRSFRALKVWMSVQVFGMAAFRGAVSRGFELAAHAQKVVERMPTWELTTPAQMGIVTFRYREGDDLLHARLVEAMLADGFALCTSTILKGRTVLRMCTINPRTTEGDIEETFRRLDGIALGLRTQVR